METDPWSTGSWPLMEEEILVINTGEFVRFNFPLTFFNRFLRPILKKGLLRPLRVFPVRDREGGERVVVEVDPDSGVELKTWVLLKISEEDDYFLTEVGPLDTG